MANSKFTKKALISSVVALLLCVTMLLGTTYAWFTDTVTSRNNIITSGNLDVELEYWDGEAWMPVTEEVKLFDENALWEPSYTDVVYLKISNAGSLALKYQLGVNIISEQSSINVNDEEFFLSEYIEFGVIDSKTEAFFETREEARDAVTDAMPISEGYSKENHLNTTEDVDYVAFVVYMPEDVGNEANHKTGVDAPTIDLGITLVATQHTHESDSFGSDYDADAPFPWDGTADTSWYNETDTEFVLTTPEQLSGLADLVDGGNTFEDKTIKLDNDIDLYAVNAEGDLISFDPIGYGYDIVFKGTFDGQAHTIKNLYQNGWALGYDYSTEGGGLFASVVDATIKNVTIDNANIVMECIDMGVLVGYSYGNCTYENIFVSNSSIANYQRYTGGVVGEVNGIQTFKNVDVAASTTVSSLWGDFDCSLGGIVGGKWGDATLTFEDCDVACTINTYNDVTSTYRWYAYRRAGMLIGNSEETKTEDGRTSATASYLTAINCTVTYGDWANYTYCEFAGTSWPYVRVQGSTVGQCSAYSNPRYGVATDANGNKVVDDTHVHNEGEDHNILLIFDQLFGGGQGVYGTATHDGVTVIYNNR